MSARNKEMNIGSYAYLSISCAISCNKYCIEKVYFSSFFITVHGICFHCLVIFNYLFKLYMQVFQLLYFIDHICCECSRFILLYCFVHFTNFGKYCFLDLQDSLDFFPPHSWNKV